MSAAEVTTALAEAIGLPVDVAALAAQEAGLPLALAEWSLNDEGDDRGDLRATLWTEDRDAFLRVAAASALPIPALPAEGTWGLGEAWRAGGGSGRRWYQVAPLDGGAALAEAAMAAFPELEPDGRRVARALGGTWPCTAVGAELADGGRRRVTLYFRVPTAEDLLRLMIDESLPDHARARLFVEGLLGVGVPARRPFPQVWIARSVGEGGGWKLYYFARRDVFRAGDDALLDAVEASPRLRRAVARLGERLPPHRPKVGRGGSVQLLGLRFSDSAPAPSWTVYLSSR